MVTDSRVKKTTKSLPDFAGHADIVFLARSIVSTTNCKTSLFTREHKLLAGSKNYFVLVVGTVLPFELKMNMATAL